MLYVELNTYPKLRTAVAQAYAIRNVRTQVLDSMRARQQKYAWTSQYGTR